ncbi:very short patch repair endonuclease [Svornostia abyssi]|uniref:Very short patch repair endonuclease n=2 Tax=Svornostia abyssi TaxID=2898438 RepID=A0ABY5PNX9_9ACTN|nr:very short patch repair endonuclease [Parviterribacteraceae bacterium J379]
MRANRGRDTGPEVALRSTLHARGLRFRKNPRLDLAGGHRVRPDVVFPTERLAVFVDGCFWHGCREHRTLPRSNASFWRQKIEGTRERDQQQVAWLEAAGWTVIRLWEHDLPEPGAQRVIEILDALRNPTPET